MNYREEIAVTKHPHELCSRERDKNAETEGLHPLSSANVIQVDGNGLSVDTESDEWARSYKPSCFMGFSLASNFGDIWRLSASVVRDCINEVMPSFKLWS
ncbi:hypothetical protein TNIN_498781 [Trichonephila inaurata madagascariensis]|uniref:Uncharacterized protein n=1 Tax=Trichonephila inaurata madagascariensis TaxID=2747483 RepID=A0A8X6MGJ3_9ARAC|nr:hypothetical protein TNIN_498781 [Trichonephila inaurata madagascariensis]